MITFFYLSCLLVLASKVSAEIGCYVEGDCSGGPLVGFSVEQDSIACHVVCMNSANCDYWTYFASDGTCLLYSEQCTLGAEAATLSGEVSLREAVLLESNYGQLLLGREAYLPLFFLYGIVQPPDEDIAR